MGTNYLPGKESLLLGWAQNFGGRIVDAPGEFGLTEPEAQAYVLKVNAFAAAYTAATEPATRGPSTIQTKNTAKRGLIAATRPLVNKVQIYPGTTDTMRVDLGITVRDVDPSPVPVPESSPVLTVVSVLGRTIRINLRGREADGNPSERRARPAGVRGASVYFAAGETFPQDITGWTFKGSTSRTTFDLTIPDTVPAGGKVYLTAQWFNTRSQTGPACPPVFTYISNGLSQAA